MNRFRFFPTSQLVGVFIVMGMLAMSCSDDKSFNVADGTKPSAPGSLTATVASDTEINLTWAASTDNTAGVGGVQGYRIIRNGTFVKATAAVTATTDDGLTASTAYVYAIEAFDGAGNISDRSTEATATTNAPPAENAPPADTEVPAAASAVTLSEAGATSIKLTWTAATDNVGVSNYVITRGTTVLATIAGDVLEYTDATAVAGTAYTYTVRALDAAGNGTTSTASAALTTGPILTAPGAPTGVATSTSAIWITWTAAADNAGGGGIQWYQVKRSGLIIATVAGDVTAYTETGLSGATNYTYTITALDNGGDASTGAASAAIRTNNSDTNPGLTGDPLVDEAAIAYSLSAATGINNTGTSTAAQSIGIAAAGGTFPAGLTTSDGTVHVGDAAANTADNSAGTIWGTASGLAADRVVAAVAAATTADPGVTNLTGVAAIDGVVTNHARGNAGALFIHQFDTALNINQNIGLDGGAVASNVYIVSTADITIAAGVTVWGSVISQGNVTLATGAKVTGRVLSGGTITLDGNTISAP